MPGEDHELARALWREIGATDTAYGMNVVAERCARARRDGLVSPEDLEKLQGGYAQRYGQLFPDAVRRGRR